MWKRACPCACVTEFLGYHFWHVDEGTQPATSVFFIVRLLRACSQRRCFEQRYLLMSSHVRGPNPYASQNVCEAAMCAWLSACFSVLALTVRLRQCLCLHPFSFMCFIDCVLSWIASVSLYGCQRHPRVMSKGYAQRHGLSENQARAERARRF